MQPPHRAETFQDPDFERLVENITVRSGMMVSPANLGTVCAFIDGFDVARGGAPLLGFREWLVVMNNGFDNRHWTGLACRTVGLSLEDDGTSEEQDRIKTLGDLIKRYLEYRAKNGVTKVFYDYGRWLIGKRWYDGPLRKRRDQQSQRKNTRSKLDQTVRPKQEADRS